jgi:hypothetical protein
MHCRVVEDQGWHLMLVGFPFFFVHHLVYVYIFQEKKVYLYAFNFYAYFMFMDAYTDFLMDWHR